MAACFLFSPPPRLLLLIPRNNVLHCQFSSQSPLQSSCRCSLRDKGLAKNPLWRTKDYLSSEAKQAAASLKLAREKESELASVFNVKISRLMKSDVLALLIHLQRSNSCDLAVKVFEYAREEIWYKPEISVYYDMIYMLGKKKMIEKAEYYFDELKEEGLQADARVYTEMICAYMEAGMVEKAMNSYNSMKDCGCRPTELTFRVLIGNLEREGMAGLVKDLERDVVEYLEEGEEFLTNLRSRKTSI